MIQMYYDKWWKNHGLHHSLQGDASVGADVGAGNSIASGGGTGGGGGRGDGGACQTKKTLDQKAMANALGVVNIGGVFVVLLCGLAFAVMVAIVEFCVSSRLARAPAAPAVPGVRSNGAAAAAHKVCYLIIKEILAPFALHHFVN